MSYKKTVLIVDDDTMIRKQLEQSLKRNFFETLQAASGEDALKIIEQGKADVVVIDVKLPGINGLEVLKKCKEKSSNTEVIVITGYGSQEIAIQALREGAIDYIEKPIIEEELNAALGRALEKLGEKKDLTYKNAILIIDDEKSAVERLKKFMEKEEFSAFGALSGGEGLDIIQKNKIDVVITDIKMPDIDGIEVLKRAKKLYSDIEVIMITGHGEQELAVKSLRAGANDYLQKPVNLDELLCSVNKAIEKISLNRTRLYRNRELKLSTEIISKMNEELERRITERTEKLTETQAQLFHTSKLATLGEMSAGLAHEMNQPLSGISLTAENMKRLMDRDSLTKENMESALGDINASIKRMSKIIQHIRIFARQETLKFSEIDVNEPIENALSLLGEQLRLHEIEVVKEYSDNLPRITGEPYQLEQVITNIISNARDAMDEKGEKNIKGYSKKLIFKTAQVNNEICIAVSDNGSGMSAEQKEKIFQPFFTTKEVGKATGLGMSISFGIVESHKGRIEVESKQGAGATIKIILPVKTTKGD
jgi:DNA-binding response OmpR family regulator